MSGGSYDYLCYADEHEILQRRAVLRQMADRLTGLGYAEDAAGETEDLIAIIAQYERRARSRIRRLSAVWRAVEWWDSNDSSEDDIRAALEKYRNGRAAPQE